jgi:uncharacterized protein (DUF1499 family)
VSTDGRLAPCPGTPNCVSTQTTDAAHAMPPIPFGIPVRDAVEVIMKVVSEQPRARVVTRDSSYVHAEFRSRLFRFVDDVEFLVDPTASVVHFRAASRVGRRHPGVNRRRMTELTALLSPRLTRDP